MTRRTQLALALVPLLAATLIVSAQQEPARQGAPLNAEQIRALIQRAIDMQHRSDGVLDEYDRTERVLDRDRDQKTTDTVSRLVPVGGGDMRVETSRDGQPVSAAEIAQEWRDVEGMIESRTHFDDPAVKKEYDKSASRKREIAKMTDAINDAFVFHYAGRTLRAGRPAVELDYQPNPDFKSSLRYAAIYRQVYGKVWIDEGSGYVVRLEAQLRQDIGIGGGIIGKVYSGARVELEQAEETPGIWLPTFSSYDVEGRKFLFPASLHRKLYASDYRHIGPPAQALALLRNEHAQVVTNGPAPTTR